MTDQLLGRASGLLATIGLGIAGYLTYVHYAVLAVVNSIRLVASRPQAYPGDAQPDPVGVS
jgi:hypothetical protein